MDLSGSFDGENSWENRSKKKKKLLHALKGIQKIIQENAFEFIQRISLSTF